MLAIIWILNFVISWANAWGCGKSWTETKHLGSWSHFMNWMGAIMSASGFTWCYTLLACFFGGSLTHEVNGQVVPYLSAMQVEAVASAGYLLIIFPILGSGLAITIHSWVTFARNRSFGNAAMAGYNTFADLYNTYNAIRDVPSAWGSVRKLLKSNSDEKGKLIVLYIVVFAALAGILTTYTILTTTARNTARSRALKYAEQS